MALHHTLNSIFFYFSTEGMDCIYCGTTFLGDNVKFCSMKCYKDHIADLEKKASEAEKNDLRDSKKKDNS